MKYWIIYVSQRMFSNFMIALDKGVWGAKREKIIAGIQKDDLILFVKDVRVPNNISINLSRCKKEEFGLANPTSRGLILVKSTSENYTDQSEIWSDEIYPYRFNFELLCP